VKKATGRVPTARTWFGFASTWSCALGANAAGTIEGVKVAKALEGMKLPPEIGLMPDQPFFRAEDHQLIGDLFVGNAQAQGKGGDDDFFNVTQIVKGTDAAPPPTETGCKLTWPS